MSHVCIQPSHVAVVTGGASGIGLAACRAFAAQGLSVVVADVNAEGLARAVEEVAAASPRGRGAVRGVRCDVTLRHEMQILEAEARDAFGRIDILMANAAVQPGSDIMGPDGAWDRILDTNLYGVIRTVQAVLPGMIADGHPGLVIVTGSKQGITTPPGDPAYNVAKAGVKAFAEAVQHDLRNRPGCRISAHLLIPGFVFTPLTANGRTEKPAGAWTPEQTVDFMMRGLAQGDFYILCPDNEVTRAVDERRMLWAASDIVENQPPLSRWHPDYADRFAAFLRGPADGE
ncbi:SDR family NAD(P)-dependent oxidoreductase [Gluconacetobacter tumulisoli]|uniref:SDR family oxidoreductase n=1 Tax=Gluconacetobacter tumulisoli TaxID=1286189 RepID=A0A7W4PKH6_9PROT|nr:SDR family oxidoreductase [Gluconacetobacter tumulisoli]MBB2201070.1 SDR family oxidoreductase [Gluconacetobacter tumulisoli]